MTSQAVACCVVQERFRLSKQQLEPCAQLFGQFVLCRLSKPLHECCCQYGGFHRLRVNAAVAAF